MTPAERFDAIAAHFDGAPAITTGTGFGASAGLRVDRKIFAMLMDDRLVVKLPRERVDALVARGVADRLQTGPGREMKEWARVEPVEDVDWLSLAAEAHAFVAP